MRGEQGRKKMKMGELENSENYKGGEEKLNTLISFNSWQIEHFLFSQVAC